MNSTEVFETPPGGEEVYNHTLRLIISIVSAVLITVTVTANGVVIVAFIRDWRRLIVKKPIKTNLFYFNLALFDLCVGLFTWPFSVVYKLGGKWHFGRVLCHIWLNSDYLLTCGSIFTLSVMAMDRYFALVGYTTSAYPSPIHRNRIIYGMIVSTWMLPCLTYIPLNELWGAVEVVENSGEPFDEESCSEPWGNHEIVTVVTNLSMTIPLFACLLIPYLLITYHIWRAHRVANQRAAAMESSKTEYSDEDPEEYDLYLNKDDDETPPPINESVLKTLNSSQSKKLKLFAAEDWSLALASSVHQEFDLPSGTFRIAIRGFSPSDSQLNMRPRPTSFPSHSRVGLAGKAVSQGRIQQYNTVAGSSCSGVLRAKNKKLNRAISIESMKMRSSSVLDAPSNRFLDLSKKPDRARSEQVFAATTPDTPILDSSPEITPERAVRQQLKEIEKVAATIRAQLRSLRPLLNMMLPKSSTQLANDEESGISENLLSQNSFSRVSETFPNKLRKDRFGSEIDYSGHDILEDTDLFQLPPLPPSPGSSFHLPRTQSVPGSLNSGDTGSSSSASKRYRALNEYRNRIDSTTQKIPNLISPDLESPELPPTLEKFAATSRPNVTFNIAQQEARVNRQAEKARKYSLREVITNLDRRVSTDFHSNRISESRYESQLRKAAAAAAKGKRKRSSLSDSEALRVSAHEKRRASRQKIRNVNVNVMTPDTAKIIKQVLVLVLICLLCWLPYSILGTLNMLTASPALVPPLLYDLSVWLVYCNSLMNPFLYVRQNKLVKLAILNNFPCLQWQLWHVLRTCNMDDIETE